MLLQRSKCSLKVLVSHLSSHLAGYERQWLTLFSLGSFQREERNLVNTESDETHACSDAHGPSPYHIEILINTVALISEFKLPCEEQLLPGYQHYSRHLLFPDAHLEGCELVREREKPPTVLSLLSTY